MTGPKSPSELDGLHSPWATVDSQLQKLMDETSYFNPFQFGFLHDLELKMSWSLGYKTCQELNRRFCWMSWQPSDHTNNLDITLEWVAGTRMGITGFWSFLEGMFRRWCWESWEVLLHPTFSLILFNIDIKLLGEVWASVMPMGRCCTALSCFFHLFQQ